MVPLSFLGLGVLALLAGAYIARKAWEIRRVDRQYRVPTLYAPNYLGTMTVSALQKRSSTPDEMTAGSEIAISSRDIPGIGETTVRVYVYERQNREKNRAALLWIHGGGLVLGNARADTALLGPFLRELNLVVVSVEYRLAPQHPYPQALDDCFAAFLWVRDHADELGIDAGRVAVGGGSAGGGLAAAVAQRALDEARVQPRFQLLIYPMLDDRTTLRRGRNGRGRLGWTPAANRFGWKSYLGQKATLKDDRPYAAAARRENLAGLPEAWIGVGDLDLFYDEDVAYCGRLRAAGVRCELDVVPNAYHGFNLMAEKAPGSIAFNQRMLEALRAGLKEGG